MTSLLLAVALIAPPQRSAYDKFEYRIPMRDGTKLYCAVYVPNNKPGKHPILLERTPYSAGPYGPGKSPFGFGGSRKLVEEGYIFAYSDVRGRYMSEGKFEEIRPINPNPKGKEIDESTDAYDTVDFLVKNVRDNNGNVGLWGISYPGFYASCATIRNHPAVKAVSPQAPVSEWFHGDDVHHNGAFFLQDNFDFYFFFGLDMPKPAEDHPQVPSFGPRPDAYEFFMKLGNAQNADTQYYKGRIPFWNEICDNPDYNEFWKARSLPPQLKNIGCAVLTVGGWFDAEDLYGSLSTYKHIEKQNPGIMNRLVMGPWSHGGWAFGSGSRLGPLNFEVATSTYFRDEIEFPFFEHHLRGITKRSAVPKVEAFQTGANQWRTFGSWPPSEAKPYSIYLGPKGSLTESAPAGEGSDSYVNDPANPIPYQPGKIRSRNATYMVADQRFLAERNDILRYRTEPLKEALTVAGPVTADLQVQTSGTDSDFIVKVIDEQPDGAQILIRWEVMRGRYRNDPSKPEPFNPAKIERVKYTMPDMFHTFQPGHRLMVQVQSSWFPLIDRNPNKLVNTYKAKPEDYQKATVKVFHSAKAASKIEFLRMPE